MKPRLIHLGVAVSLAAASAGLAGCGSATPGAAAVVDGHEIKDADVWSIISDLGRVPDNKGITVNDVLPALIQAQVVQEHAAELKAPDLSTDAVKTQLDAQKLGSWNPATIKALRDVNVLSQVLQSTSQAKALSLIQNSDVSVNPKYGTFDKQRLALDPSAPNWMVATPAPTADQGIPQQQPQQPQGNPTTLPGSTATPTAGSAVTTAPGTGSGGSGTATGAASGTAAPTTSR